MGYGSSYGKAYGDVPEPDEFEELSEQEKNEYFRKIFNKQEELMGEFEDHKSKAEKWRRNSWLWRVSSFITGNVTGILISVLI